MAIKITLKHEGLISEVWTESDEWYYTVYREADGYSHGGDTEGFESKEIATEEASITMEDIINNPEAYYD